MKITKITSKQQYDSLIEAGPSTPETTEIQSATARPWSVREDGRAFLVAYNGETIARISTKLTEQRMAAEDIVRAVNAHDALVAALRAMLADYRSEGCPDPTCHVCRTSKTAEDKARAALKLDHDGSGTGPGGNPSCDHDWVTEKGGLIDTCFRCGEQRA